VLDELGIAQAHFVGASYGGRLCFGIGEYAPQRVLTLVAGGQQPFAIDEDRPLARAIFAALERTRREGIAAFVEALERYWSTRFPEPARSRYLEQDGKAVASAAEALFTQGDVSRDLGAWTVPCLIYLGAADVDFLDGAQRAAEEIPGAQLVTLDELDHLGAHYESEPVVPAILRTLRRSRPHG
jgi:pimeloyl-ACP methyl ester carboxylesterase